MNDLRKIPLAFVVLDIIKSSEGANWYRIEQRAPLHQDFVDQAYSVREVLTGLLEDGFVRSVGEGPMPTLELTTTGEQLHDELTPVPGSAVAAITFDERRWAAPPRGPRFATEVQFAFDPRRWLLRGSFLDGKGGWSTLAMVSLIDANSPSELLASGARFSLLSGDLVVGRGRVVLANPIETEREFDAIMDSPSGEGPCRYYREAS